MKRAKRAFAQRAFALRTLAVLAMAALLALASACEETKVIQGMDLSVAATETQSDLSSPFNRLATGGEWSLGSYSWTNLSLRFQTRELSGRIAASAQGGAQDPFAISIDQAWIKATIGEGWGIAFGRRDLGWKDGGVWNPSDIVDNSLAWNATGSPPGKDSVEVIGLLPFRDFNLDISAATVLASGIESPAELPLYLALGSILYPIELRAKLALQEGRQPFVGGAAKLSLPAGELYADALWLSDHPLAATVDPSFSPAGAWFRYCAGAAWTVDLSSTKIASTLGLRMEYLRQDDGLSPQRMKSYAAYLEGLSLSTPTEVAAYGQAAGLWRGRFFALGKDYLYFGLDLGEIALLHLGLSSSCVLNIDDFSVALRNSLSWSPKNLFTLSLSASNYLGDAGSEARMLPASASYSLTLARSF
jgi:hypothetical protein